MFPGPVVTFDPHVHSEASYDCREPVELVLEQAADIGLGVETMPEPGQSFPASVAAIRERGGIAVLPHPFQWLRHGVRKRNVVDCDAVEVYNSWLLTVADVVSRRQG